MGVLALARNGLTAFGLKPLLASGNLSSLRELRLDHNRLSDLGAQVLARWPGLKNIRRLDLNNNGIGDAGACELARSPYLVRLNHLGLSWNQHSAETVAAFNDPAVRSRIDTLGLDTLELDDL